MQKITVYFLLLASLFLVLPKEVFHLDHAAETFQVLSAHQDDCTTDNHISVQKHDCLLLHLFLSCFLTPVTQQTENSPFDFLVHTCSNSPQFAQADVIHSQLRAPPAVS